MSTHVGVTWTMRRRKVLRKLEKDHRTETSFLYEQSISRTTKPTLNLTPLQSNDFTLLYDPIVK